jgi:hypothetical protein
MKFKTMADNTSLNIAEWPKLLQNIKTHVFLDVMPLGPNSHRSLLGLFDPEMKNYDLSKPRIWHNIPEDLNLQPTMQ